MSFIAAVTFLKLPNSLSTYKSNSVFFSPLQAFEILRASAVVFFSLTLFLLASVLSLLLCTSINTVFSVPFSQLLNTGLCKKFLKQLSRANWIADLKKNQNHISRVLYLYNLQKHFRTMMSKICNAIKILCSAIAAVETHPLQCSNSMINISNGCVYCKLGAPCIWTWFLSDSLKPWINLQEIKALTLWLWRTNFPSSE